ncbi:hypothetical protein AWB80_04813 [Caballeronia pedi]|uniref:Uncharacterized protein n=1 Tax=Caballeronia pedi TaxID=1777141 RepID=A0A158C8L5_9BURK|nr:hypothetical protein AWB80_04813 [Caballeronia pedi]
MLMLQQGRETFVRVTHAVDDGSPIHIEANRQGIDQQPQSLIDARLHAPEQHGAEHDASIGVDCTARVQHARPGEMTEARETHAEVSGLCAQTRIERCGQRHACFADGRAVMMHIGETEGQRRFVHIGEHVAEERFVRLLIRIEPRLRDQIAERLSRAERIALAVDDRIDFRMHHIERRMIADQVMPVQLNEPAPALRFGRDRDSHQGSLREIEAFRAGIEMPRQRPVDLRNRHGRLAPDDLSSGAEAIVDKSGAQDVVPFDDVLQGIEPRVEPCAAIEGETRGLQIRIALRGQHMMEQNAFLQRRK